MAIRLRQEALEIAPPMNPDQKSRAPRPDPGNTPDHKDFSRAGFYKTHPCICGRDRNHRKGEYRTESKTQKKLLVAEWKGGARSDDVADYLPPEQDLRRSRNIQLEEPGGRPQIEQSEDDAWRNLKRVTETLRTDRRFYSQCNSPYRLRTPGPRTPGAQIASTGPRMRNGD